MAIQSYSVGRKGCGLAMADVFGRSRLRPGSARVHRAEIVPEMRAEHQNREGGPSGMTDHHKEFLC